MLITKKHISSHEFIRDEIYHLQEYSRFDLPEVMTSRELINNSRFPIESKDICDISIREFCFGRNEFYAHYEIYFAIQTALNMLRILENKQIISLAFLCRDQRTQTAIYKRNGKIVLQIDQQFGSFIERLFGKKKEFWNCITLFHRFIIDQPIVDITDSYILEDRKYSEATIKGFPKSNLGIEYALRQEEEDSISLDYLNTVLKTYKLDDKTLKGIKALING